MNKILLVEDDVSLGESLKQYLEFEKFQVHWSQNLQEAQAIFEKEKLDLVILDWMLPDGQGIDFLRSVRKENSFLPVIMLTARTDLVDKILGLESGSNDYITKPFEPRELVARVRVQMRQEQPAAVKSTNKLSVNNIVIDSEQRQVTLSGVAVELTKMEFDLLKLLAEVPNKVFSREEILNKVWGYENYPTTRTVDTHILQLRQKFYDHLFETVRGIGYRLKLEENS